MTYLGNDPQRQGKLSCSPASHTDDVPRVRRLHELATAARRAWPAFEVPIDVFVAHLERSLPDDAPSLAGLATLHVDDLYLACACARGSAAAIEALEATCMTAADKALARLRLKGDDADEIKQRVRALVLVGDGERPPRIASYRGVGPLRGWLSVIATREGQALLRRSGREQNIDEAAALQDFVARADGELAQLKDRFRAAFASAFDAALRTLSAKDRLLLRQHVLDRATLRELAGLYRVHHSTVGRAVESVRETVLAETRARLRAQLGIASAELDSILRLVRSRLEIDLDALRPRKPPK